MRAPGLDFVVWHFIREYDSRDQVTWLYIGHDEPLDLISLNPSADHLQGEIFGTESLQFWDKGV